MDIMRHFGHMVILGRDSAAASRPMDNVTEDLALEIRNDILGESPIKEVYLVDISCICDTQ